MHAGVQGGTDLTVDDHGWTDPVARITVSVSEADDMMGLPSTGTGFSDGGSSVSQLLIFLAIAGVALFALGGAFRLARRTTR